MSNFNSQIRTRTLYLPVMQGHFNRYATEKLKTEKKVNINERELTSLGSGGGTRTHVTCPMKAGWHHLQTTPPHYKTDIKTNSHPNCKF